MKSVSVQPLDGYNAGARSAQANRNRAAAAVLPWSSTRIASSLSWPSTRIGPWMRYSGRCTSSGFRAAEPRSGDFSSVMTSLLKKSLCAAERHRADVARRRRRWIRQQGFLDTTRLVFIDETSITTNMVRVRGRCPRGERPVQSCSARRMENHHLYCRVAA